MATNTVTIDAAYLATLLRRAQFHSGDIEYPPPPHCVTIPKQEHDNLLESARQYANLRRNLFRGGIAEETLAILTKDDTLTNEHTGMIESLTINTPKSGTLLTLSQPAAPDTNERGYTFGVAPNYTPRCGFGERDLHVNDSLRHSPDTDESFMLNGPDRYYGGAGGINESQSRALRLQHDKFAKRTVLLANLPERTTHADIAEVIRGGMILDIFLRSHDRAASISFLEEVAAREFFRHVKRHDLYINGKRVEIRWNDRQFILPSHVANKISTGATRNLVIYNRSPRHTEEAIREDLDHIHNLVVVKIRLSGQNAFISLNSVHNAMFARTCMMSRTAYKGYKIEWGNDECAAPLEAPAQPRKNSATTKKESGPLTNRFQLLNMDAGEDDSDGDDHDHNVTLPTVLTASPIGMNGITT